MNIQEIPAKSFLFQNIPYTKNCCMLKSVNIYCLESTEVVIPREVNGRVVTQIGSKSFVNCTSLTSIVIPNGVKTISEFAFCNCTSLTSVEIPDSVTHIDNYVFLNCKSLLSIKYLGTKEQWEDVDKKELWNLNEFGSKSPSYKYVKRIECSNGNVHSEKSLTDCCDNTQSTLNTLTSCLQALKSTAPGNMPLEFLRKNLYYN